VYKQVAVWQEYDIPVSFTPRCIVDLGANIGLSALFFSARYPDATVYAYEPQSENFELLLRNTRQNSQVFPVQRAVWGHRIPCEVRSTGTEHWAAKIAEAAPGGSRHTITVSEIIEDHELELIDILKIDIEGAERSVFTGDVSWLSRVRLVIIELHDFLEPGCAQAFFNALKDTPYTLEVVGENFVVRNRGLS
jgi:FkbM family methyltransferase